MAFAFCKDCVGVTQVDSRHYWERVLGYNRIIQVAWKYMKGRFCLKIWLNCDRESMERGVCQALPCKEEAEWWVFSNWHGQRPKGFCFDPRLFPRAGYEFGDYCLLFMKNQGTKFSFYPRSFQSSLSSLTSSSLSSSSSSSPLDDLFPPPSQTGCHGNVRLTIHRKSGEKFHRQNPISAQEKPLSLHRGKRERFLECDEYESMN